MPREFPRIVAGFPAHVATLHCGGRGTHQVYVKGLPDHRLKDADIVDHLVEMVEAKAAELEAEASPLQAAE